MSSVASAVVETKQHVALAELVRLGRERVGQHEMVNRGVRAISIAVDHRVLVERARVAKEALLAGRHLEIAGAENELVVRDADAFGHDRLLRGAGVVRG
jgi:hypothetical protein